MIPYHTTPFLLLFLNTLFCRKFIKNFLCLTALSVWHGLFVTLYGSSSCLKGRMLLALIYAYCETMLNFGQ